MELSKIDHAGPPDLICFSHLRWNFVFQRPQHLMTRFARDRRVFFIEEPMFHDGEPEWRLETVAKNVLRCIPMVNDDHLNGASSDIFRYLVNALADEHNCRDSAIWFYTPMMLDWAADLKHKAVIYDCMDELSAFKNAPAGMLDKERRLMSVADLIFAGGRSLFEAKKHKHPSVYEFPSSIDAGHFRQARVINDEMPDQAGLPHPRIGYAGVIDERMDLGLLAELADMRPEWTLIMLGPVVKIDGEDLPKRSNIHYLGQKDYNDLPGYFAGWDVGMMPFALNESTEYISPTKTPEYLSAGLPVVSTPIIDVIDPYGERGLVHIASSAGDFNEAIHFALAENKNLRLLNVEKFLKNRSWENTFSSMNELIETVVHHEIRAEAAFSV